MMMVANFEFERAWCYAESECIPLDSVKHVVVYRYETDSMTDQKRARLVMMDGTMLEIQKSHYECQIAKLTAERDIARAESTRLKEVMKYYGLGSDNA